MPKNLKRSKTKKGSKNNKMNILSPSKRLTKKLKWWNLEIGSQHLGELELLKILEMRKLLQLLCLRLLRLVKKAHLNSYLAQTLRKWLLLNLSQLNLQRQTKLATFQQELLELAHWLHRERDLKTLKNLMMTRVTTLSLQKELLKLELFLLKKQQFLAQVNPKYLNLKLSTETSL